MPTQIDSDLAAFAVLQIIDDVSTTEGGARRVSFSQIDDQLRERKLWPDISANGAVSWLRAEELIEDAHYSADNLAYRLGPGSREYLRRTTDELISRFIANADEWYCHAKRLRSALKQLSEGDGNAGGVAQHASECLQAGQTKLKYHSLILTPTLRRFGRPMITESMSRFEDYPDTPNAHKSTIEAMAGFVRAITPIGTNATEIVDVVESEAPIQYWRVLRPLLAAIIPPIQFPTVTFERPSVVDCEALRQLRAEFIRDADRFPDLRCVAVLGSVWNIFARHEEIETMLGHSLSGRRCLYTETEELAGTSFRAEYRLYSLGDPIGGRLFAELATAASNVIGTFGGASEWLRYLFLTAWDWREGCALRAKKATMPKVAELPDVFYSVITMNPFRASVILIDELNGESDALPSANDSGFSSESKQDSLRPSEFRQLNNELSTSQLSIIDALGELNSINQETGYTRARVVKHAKLKAKADSLSGPIADLRTRRLTDSRAGRNGRVWLTERGVAFAKYRADSLD